MTEEEKNISSCDESCSCGGDCSSCGESCSSCDSKSDESMLIPGNTFSDINKVIAVISGKGGVGKSFVTAMLSVIMRRRGRKVSVLDADITGPSIPKMFGRTEKAVASEMGILPIESETGIELMSVNCLLDDETTPVLWRGPVISGVVTQFWQDVMWGDVDFMFVDMPPGTGDVPLTVFQSMPVDGIIVVTSPQELVGMIAEKAVNMADAMNIPILGIVENMSYFECTYCKKRHEVFGKSNVEEIADRFGIDTVTKLPLRSDMAAAADNGEIESVILHELEAIADMLEK